MKRDPMTEENAATISAQLSLAWELLSGEIRTFNLVRNLENSPPFAEFTYVIPMRAEKLDLNFAVGILIQRGDAFTVASSMFGIARTEVPEADLRDACAEVCNIFSECMSHHVYPHDKVTAGLPFELDESTYKNIVDVNGRGPVYSSQWNDQILVVVMLKP